MLVAKKRYVGNKYEYPDDEPTFDDKGHSLPLLL